MVPEKGNEKFKCPPKFLTLGALVLFLIEKRKKSVF